MRAMPEAFDVVVNDIRLFLQTYLQAQKRALDQNQEN